MKYWRHWLQILTWRWVVVVLTALSAWSILCVACELFVILGSHPKALDLQRWWSPESDPFQMPLVVRLPIVGHDVGYHFGGLVLCTLVRKVIVSDMLVGLFAVRFRSMIRNV